MREDARSAAARRAAIAAQIQADTGVNEPMIERLIRGFYMRVRNDDVLGPIFAAKIDDWEPHLQKMCAFWSSVTLMSGRYHGQPVAKHLPLPIDARHFDRWLALFKESARDLCPPEAAEHFVMLARRIAESSGVRCRQRSRCVPSQGRAMRGGMNNRELQAEPAPGHPVGKGRNMKPESGLKGTLRPRTFQSKQQLRLRTAI